MPIDISSISGSSYMPQSGVNITGLIDVLIAQERKKLEELEAKKDSFYSKKNVLSKLHTKLATLKNKAQDLKSPLLDNFNAKKAKSSNSDYIGVSAKSSAQVGSHSIVVERLAVNDTRVSKQFSSSSNSFSAYTTDQVFYIEVAHPTSEDPTNRVSIEVTVGAEVFSGDDASVLKAIANAINDAMNNSVLNGTITRYEKVEASVVSEQNGVSRLVLKSVSSGYDYRMEFLDSGDGILSFLEVNLNNKSEGGNGGFIFNVGTSVSDSELNAKFILDGMTFYRNSNYVTDALEGVSIQLLNKFETPITISISSNIDAVKDTVRNFLNAYNDVLNFIIDNTGYDSQKNEYKGLTEFQQFQQIKYDLRNIMTSAVNGVINNRYDRLASIGITSETITGTLNITDSRKFEEALEASPANVAEIFVKDGEGIADKVISFIDRFIGGNGLIAASKKIIDERVEFVNHQIDQMNSYLETRENQLRNEYYKLQRIINMLENQQSYFLNYYQTLFRL